MSRPLAFVLSQCHAQTGRRVRQLTARAAAVGRPRWFSNTQTVRDDRPFRMAVIGSGPAGFYTALRVMRKIQGAKVDMYEALPVPYGLVRFGVAPDHPEVKNCQEKFEEVAGSPDFTFIGNVSVGRPSFHAGGGSVPLTALARNYDAVVFAYGAAEDRKLGIPGEDTLKGVYSAREFVGWYNGLPQHADLDPCLDLGEEAVIIGQGNVALDVARILLTDVDALRKTDIAEHALEALSRSRVKRVHVVGRRGPMQAAFTIKEARELMNLPGVAFQPIEKGLIPPDPKALPRPTKRLMMLLLENKSSPADHPAEKAWSLDFLRSPIRFDGDAKDPSRLGSVTFQRNDLDDVFSPKAQVLGRSGSEDWVVPSALAFRSIGYRSVPLAGFSDLGVKFDDRRGVVFNDGASGRVLSVGGTEGPPTNHDVSGSLYSAGWVKTGPTGVIASTMEDAFTTADAITHDWQAQTAPRPPRHGWDAVAQEEVGIRGAKVVSWKDWQKIDAAERERGQAEGRERIKFPTTSEMLSVLS